MPEITDPAALAQIQAQQRRTLAGPATVPPYYPPMPEPTMPNGAPLINPYRREQGENAQARLGLSERRETALLPSQASKASTDAELARLELRKKRTEQGLDPDTGKPISGAATLVGEQAIADLSPGERDIVKGIVQGRVPVTSLALSRNPQLYKLTQRAFQYEPGTDLTTFSRRQAAFQRFMSNPNSPMVRVNQALQHLDRFAKNAEGLNNYHSGFFAALNYPRTWTRALASDPKLAAFLTDRDALATELAAAFQGTGSSALADREEWKARLSAAQSPEAFQQTITEAVQLLGGRIEASNAQFKQSVGANADFYDLMSPEARKVYQKFSGNDPEAATNKQLSTSQKALPIPEGYQRAHSALLRAHPRGTLTPEIYTRIRQSLDEQFKDQLQGYSTRSTPEEIKHFVDEYNRGAPISKIPSMNVPLGNIGDFTLNDPLSRKPLEQARAKFASGPVGTLATNFFNAGSGGLVDLAIGQEGREAKDLANQANPKAALVGELGGSVIGMNRLQALGLKGGRKFLQRFERKALEDAPEYVLRRDAEATARQLLARDIVTNAVYGGARGFAGANEGEGTSGAITGAIAGTVGAGIGNVATKGITPVFSEATANALSRLQGIKATTLQRLGLGKVEETLSGIPFSHGARAKSIESFNTDNWNRALSFIGAKVPKGMKPGTEMNAYGNSKLNEAFDTIRPQIKGSVDKPFEDAYAAIKIQGTATPERAAMFNEIEDALKPLVDETGHYSGQGYKEASERLRYLGRHWSVEPGSTATSAISNDMARLAEKTRQQMQFLVQRQTPEVGQRLKNVERAYARAVRIEDASNRAMALNESVYSPGQLLNSIKKLDTSVRKSASARGRSLDQPYAEAAARILGSSGVPNKISIKETSYVLAALGLGAYSAPVIAPIVGGMATGLYGPGLKQIIQKILTGKRPTAIDNEIVRRAIQDFARHEMTGD